MLDARNEKLSIYQNYSKQYESKEEKYKKTKNLQKNEKELEEVKKIFFKKIKLLLVKTKRKSCKRRI